MDKIFTQEELFWLDDILPGTKIGRIRRLSAARHVRIPKMIVNEHNETATVNECKLKFLFSHFDIIDVYFVVRHVIIHVSSNDDILSLSFTHSLNHFRTCFSVAH
jgi:hypothetical protein